jgi:hypothetical protein
MSLRLSAFCFILACAAALIVGCDQSPSAESARPGDAAKAPEPTPNEDTGQGDGYAYHIRYPQLPAEWSALADALRAYAEARKKDLLDARIDAPAMNAPPAHLDLEFNIARRTSDFVSVSASGSLDSGGAHPAPIVASFNLHSSDGKLIMLPALFSDADAALNALSVEARRQLQGRFEARLREALAEKNQADAVKNMREWVERGTEAKAENFAVFLIDGLDAKAIGLTLIFPPYQVASYADGTQQIEVPAKVFYKLLKPEYTDAFQIDTDAEKLAPGVR